MRERKALEEEEEGARGREGEGTRWNAGAGRTNQEDGREVLVTVSRQR